MPLSWSDNGVVGHVPPYWRQLTLIDIDMFSQRRAGIAKHEPIALWTLDAPAHIGGGVAASRLIGVASRFAGNGA